MVSATLTEGLTAREKPMLAVSCPGDAMYFDAHVPDASVALVRDCGPAGATVEGRLQR